jgi:hypothetical protein
MEVMMDRAWAGIDAEKEFHWTRLLDGSGRRMLSRKIESDEAGISASIGQTLSLVREGVWTVDQTQGGAVLLFTVMGREPERSLHAGSHSG